MQDNRRIYTVGQVNRYIKRMLEEDFLLNGIFVKGEISNCKYHYSGHIYFSLKDETGVIPAVMFASNASGLRLRLEDGMKVVVSGSIGVYERDGRYQLYARRIEHEGEGDLFRRFEELKKRLQESGMFEAAYKKPIPRFSMKIGVVTAETGAVIRDIYQVASRRNPYCRIYLYPAKVQGEGAAATICEGLRRLDQMNLDVIIIGRGGGSIEDLWAFNEEIVAREIFRTRTPVISAVGHETDFTIADFAADLRAPTPSAAAELAVFDYARFENDLAAFRYGLKNHMNGKLRDCQNRLQAVRFRLDSLTPEKQLLQKKQRLTDALNFLNEQMGNTLAARREKLIACSERLHGLSPLKRLSEGYAFISGADGTPVHSVQQLLPGDSIEVTLSDGSAHAQVQDIKKEQPL